MQKTCLDSSGQVRVGSLAQQLRPVTLTSLSLHSKLGALIPSSTRLSCGNAAPCPGNSIT